MALCEIKNVTKTYGDGATQVHAVKDVTLTIEAGEFTAFVGPSGSGKTTLLNQVGCLDKPTSGSVSIDGVTTTGLGDKALSAVRGDKIGFIFQSYNLIPVLTAAENVELALSLAKEPGGRARAVQLLDEVGLQGLADRRPNQLSGGQQQRVAVVAALNVLVGMLLVMSSMAIANTILMAAHERTREVGTLRAMGMARSGILRLFLAEGALLGAVAGSIGAAMGGGMAWYLSKNPIDLNAMKGEALGNDVAYSSFIYGVFNMQMVLVPLVISILVALIASVYPARLASLMEPADAVRAE